MDVQIRAETKLLQAWLRELVGTGKEGGNCMSAQFRDTHLL